MMRATAEIIHSEPKARLSGVSSAPRWVTVHPSSRGVPSQCRRFRYSRTGWTRMSRATAPTLRLTTTGATLISRRCSHSAQRTSSASVHGRGMAASPSSHGSGRFTTISWRNSSNTSVPANASSQDKAVMTLASLRSGVPFTSMRSWFAQRGRIAGRATSPVAFSRRRSSPTCFSRIETAMPVALLIAVSTCRSGSGSRRAWTSCPRM